MYNYNGWTKTYLEQQQPVNTLKHILVSTLQYFKHNMEIIYAVNILEQPLTRSVITSCDYYDLYFNILHLVQHQSTTHCNYCTLLFNFTSFAALGPDLDQQLDLDYSHQLPFKM